MIWKKATWWLRNQIQEWENRQMLSKDLKNYEHFETMAFLIISILEVKREFRKSVARDFCRLSLNLYRLVNSHRIRLMVLLLPRQRSQKIFLLSLSLIYLGKDHRRYFYFHFLKNVEILILPYLHWSKYSLKTNNSEKYTWYMRLPLLFKALFVSSQPCLVEWW